MSRPESDPYAQRFLAKYYGKYSKCSRKFLEAYH